MFENTLQVIFGFLLVLSSLGVILATKPVYSALSFLLTLILLAAHYLELSAHFIAVMQIIVYAGAILVMFMFVIVLFQDAHAQLAQHKPKSSKPLLLVSAVSFLAALGYLGRHVVGLEPQEKITPPHFGTVQSLGNELYVAYFFPFEALILLFLVAIVGALYLGRKRV